MKKLFLALSCAVLTLSTVACNNEEDMPTPVNGQQNAIEASFPKGAEVKTLNVNVSDLQRTRVTDMEQGLTYWAGYNSHGFKIRYAVYTDDYKLFYSSDSAESEVTTPTGSFTLKVPAPAEKTGWIFVWADKLGKESADKYQGYRINWEDFTVSMPAVIGEGALKDMSRYGDAWCYFGKLTPGTDNLSLKRKMGSIMLATDEFELPTVAEKFGNSTITTSYWFGKEGEECSSAEEGYRVASWNWKTKEVTFAKNQFAVFHTVPMETRAEFTSGSRTFYPLMAAYYFCDEDPSQTYANQHLLNGIDRIFFSIKDINGFEKIISMKHGSIGTSNLRWIFSPKPYSSGEGGIFTSGNGDIHCNVDENWNGTMGAQID
ncbi:MAG: hypothetical protein HDR48_03700 [Bacteroides sp.]|nr:hypothetical protein [Bacteroides sp.]